MPGLMFRFKERFRLSEIYREGSGGGGGGAGRPLHQCPLFCSRLPPQPLLSSFTCSGLCAVVFEIALLSVALAGLEFAVLMPRLPNAGTVRACLQAQQGCLIFFFCTWGLQIPLDLRYVVSLINPPQLKKNQVKMHLIDFVSTHHSLA